MRTNILICFLVLLAVCDAFQPVMISIKRSQQPIVTTTEDPLNEGYDPFDIQDSSFFTDLTNSSKRIKLQLETTQYIQKYGAQELLNMILRKVQKVTLPQNSKGAINDFLNFVEDLIYKNSAERIEKKMKTEIEAENANLKLHDGEATSRSQKPAYDSKDVRRRDAPALSQNSVLIGDDDFPAVRQPIEPTKLMFFSNPMNLMREESMVGREIRRSPSKNSKKKSRLSKTQLEKAIKSAEREARELEMEKILTRRRAQRKEQVRRRKEKQLAMQERRASKKLPIAKIEERNMRRSPLPGRVTFNEKMFQLLEEYGIRTFRVETADFTVRASANPQKTRFSSVNLLDVPEYNDAIRRKPSRPPFVYSRTIVDSKQNSRVTRGRSLKKKKRMLLERLL